MRKIALALFTVRGGGGASRRQQIEQPLEVGIVAAGADRSGCGHRSTRWRQMEAQEVGIEAAAADRSSGDVDRRDGRGSTRQRQGATRQRRSFPGTPFSRVHPFAIFFHSSGADRCVGGRRSFPAAASSIVDPSRGDDLANVPLQACFAVLEPGRAEVRGALQRSAILCRAMVPGEKVGRARDTLQGGGLGMP
uniref:Uncharacterized protein n=1 Tax=Oryza sativa subsp. japonica TaxID=39947 RepID=Q6ET93_ORYSJ|nr:unknown protein [Oryza sativa Japonica Group]BAD28127.1 unknown protein [Oryza sativa Japonica Group]